MDLWVCLKFECFTKWLCLSRCFTKWAMRSLFVFKRERCLPKTIFVYLREFRKNLCLPKQVMRRDWLLIDCFQEKRLLTQKRCLNAYRILEKGLQLPNRCLSKTLRFLKWVCFIKSNVYLNSFNDNVVFAKIAL